MVDFTWDGVGGGDVCVCVCGETILGTKPSNNDVQEFKNRL